jgi:hypothetical protein
MKTTLLFVLAVFLNTTNIYSQEQYKNDVLLLKIYEGVSFLLTEAVIGEDTITHTGITEIDLLNDEFKCSEIKHLFTSNPDFNNPTQNVTFSGTLLYEDPQTSNNNPVNNWLLLLFESDTYSDLETIDENDPHTDWPVSSGTGNGTYSVTINITKAWFVLGVGLRRYSGTHMDYFIGRWEIIGAETLIVSYDLLTEIGQNIYTQWSFSYTYEGSQTDGILETLRRCAYIGNRIDFSISTNVGGDDLATIQSLVIGTRNDDGVMPDGSGASFGEPENNTSYIQIGPQAEFDLWDAVIIHEHGHTLMFALTNYEWRAGGDHYADQKNRTNMAFSEGWADFWACTVTNNSALYSQNPYSGYQLDINTVEAQNFIVFDIAIH